MATKIKAVGAGRSVGSSTAVKARAAALETETAKQEKRAKSAVPRKKITAAKRQRKSTTGRSAVVGKILKHVEHKLQKEVGKASLGDYIRLVQLQKELDADKQPQEIKVTWVEPKMAEVKEQEAGTASLREG